MDPTANGKVSHVVTIANQASTTTTTAATVETSLPSTGLNPISSGQMNGSANRMAAASNGSPAVHAMDEVYSDMFMDVEDSPGSYFLGHHNMHGLQRDHGFSMMLSDDLLDKKIVDKIVHLDFFNKFDDLLDLNDLA